MTYRILDVVHHDAIAFLACCPACLVVGFMCSRFADPSLPYCRMHSRRMASVLSNELCALALLGPVSVSDMRVDVAPAVFCTLMPVPPEGEFA